MPAPKRQIPAPQISAGRGSGFGPGRKPAGFEAPGRGELHAIKAALNRQAMVLTSDGTAKRTFCYLADAVSALFHILLKGESGSPYNVGNSANKLSIRDFTTLGAALCEPPLPIVFGAVDPSIYLPATTRRGHPVTTLIESLGWKPAHDVADALSRTYRSFLP